MTVKASIWILGSGLLAAHPVLAEVEALYGRENLVVVLVECRRRLRKRPYQAKKLVLLLSAMRHYAWELRTQGYTVDYVQAETFTQGLRRHVQDWQPEKLFMMAASDYGGWEFQRERLPELLDVPVVVRPNSQFLNADFDPYPNPGATKRYTMEYFYRKMRRHFGVLMDGDDPVGGAWNFDKQNRQQLPSNKQAPAIISFTPDEMTQGVMAEVGQTAGLMGTVSGFDLAVTRADARAAFEDFLAHRLAEFGPYEDAMSSTQTHLYHSKLSAYLNIGLLQPLELLRAVEEAYRSGAAPINSVEGFVRQILGWREFINWQYRRLMPGLLQGNYWVAKRPLPQFFWDGQTELNCLHHVLRRAVDTGYNHHIERLMVLSNFCLLAGIEPLEVNEWFLAMYIDAYDWVMVPNVLGMGLNADGGIIATKPYIASANYINKMSEYCPGCRYDHKARTGEKACPFNTLYWNFLLENEETLRANPRMGPNVLGLRYVDEQEREVVRAEARVYLEGLEAFS